MRFGEKPSWEVLAEISTFKSIVWVYCKCCFILKRVLLYHARTKIILSFLKFWVTKLGRQRCEFDLQTSTTCDVWFFHFTASIEIETRRYTNCALNILHQIEHSSDWKGQQVVLCDAQIWFLRSPFKKLFRNKSIQNKIKYVILMRGIEYLGLSLLLKNNYIPCIDWNGIAQKLYLWINLSSSFLLMYNDC